MTRTSSAIWIFCLSASLILIAGCGSNSSTSQNPAPAITSLSPSSVSAGAAAQTLTITGTGFVSTSAVTYNGVSHAATFASSTQLSISLTAGDQATAGTYAVVVTNPSPGGGTSNSAPFTVNNLVPSVASLAPSSVTAGAVAQSLTITGANFVAGSTVTYNGAAHTASFTSSTQLSITLSSSDQAKVGTFAVVVTNPSPGGGASNSRTFTVLSPVVVSDSGDNRVLIYNAAFSTGESAHAVLGQADFTHADAALTASGMNGPAGIATDGLGNIYVSDSVNNRVLQFKPPFTNGMSASLVIGQPDFVTGAGNTTQNGLTGPAGLAFDNSGNLWVVDLDNNRVLEYKPPFANNMNASVVIGQADFTSSAFATSASGLTLPFSVGFDASGDLWVTDGGNSRVLEFKPPFVNGMAASLVIGQTDFTSFGTASPPTASSLSSPVGVAFDSLGNLWVGDTSNNRVLEFQPTFATGMSASLVLGQADFTTSAAATTQSGLSSPFEVGFDSNGNLWVADFGNSRTLMFSPAFSDGQNASLVLGQANFTSATGATTVTGENSPFGITAAF